MVDLGQLINLSYPENYFLKSWHEYFCMCGCNKFVLEIDDFSEQIEFVSPPDCAICEKGLQPWDILYKFEESKTATICFRHHQKEENK